MLMKNMLNLCKNRNCNVFYSNFYEIPWNILRDLINISLDSLRYSTEYLTECSIEYSNL